MDNTTPTKVRDMYDAANASHFAFQTTPGLSPDIVRSISQYKKEPAWVLEKRLQGLDYFFRRPLPAWGPDLSGLNLDTITYFADPGQVEARSWDDVPPDIRATFDRLGIPKAERESLAGTGAQYECLAGDTLVYTRDKGPVPIKDIQPGDYVFSYDHVTNQLQPARVKGISRKGVRKVYKAQVGTRTIKATANHPFLSLVDKRKPGRQRSRYQKEWKQFTDISAGDLVAVAKELPNAGKTFLWDNTETPKLTADVTNQFGAKFEIPIIYKKGVKFPTETTNDLLWLFGFFLGDGYIRKQVRKGQLCFAIHDQNWELRQELIRVVRKVFGYPITENHPYVLRVSSTLICRFFEQAGFSGNAHTKKVPVWVYTLPTKQQLAFLSGYIDADGYVKREKNSVVITSVNRPLLKEMHGLANYIGELKVSNVNCFTSAHVYDKSRMLTAYRLQLGGNIGKIPCRNPKRHRRLPHPGARRRIPQYATAEGATFRRHVSKSVGFARIKSIEPAGEEAVYDIEVEGYHNFVAEGLIVHNSAMAYHNLKEEWEKLGVIFENFDVAIAKYPDLVRPYFMTRCVPINDHKFAALHAAVFSGGTFIYVPPGVTVTLPLQAYFRMNGPGLGQFEHTLIIADEGSRVEYIEGCSAPQYSVNNLHAGCVEIYVKPGARVRYSSIENWSKNTYNLNTKRAIVEKDGVMEWVNGNLGCLTEDAKIFTNPKGPISIKNIRPGDKVYAWDESSNTIKKTKVKEKIFSGTKEVFQVEAGGREIQASANHPFLTLRHRKNEKFHKKGFFHFEWLPLYQLQVGDVVAVAKTLPHTGKAHKIPQYIFDTAVESNNQYGQFKMATKHLFNQNLFIPQETTPELMWLLGILLGDGHVDVGRNKINIATHITEDYRDYVCSLLKTLFNYDVTEKKERYIIINSKVLCWLFSELGFAGNADTKHLPEWVFGLPEDQIMALLAGYFDSDGHPTRNGLTFTSINKNLLYDIKHLGMSIGFGVSRIFKHGVAGEMEILGVKCQAKDSWRIQFNGKKIYRLPVHSRRKKGRISLMKTRRSYASKTGWNFRSKTTDQVGFASIGNIISLGIKPTWDIEVEKYHNFIANGLIVHNSGVTMLYPSSVLVGEGAKTDFIGVAFAGGGQNQDTGSKALHLAPNTSSTIIGKSISKDGGTTTYRGLLKVARGAHGVRSSVTCDALIMDETSVSNTIPYMDVREQRVDIGHEATVGKISADQLFYLQSRGLSAAEATQLIVSGFIEPIVKRLPLEYAVELNRLIELEMEGSVG